MELSCQDISSFGFTFPREDFCPLLGKKYFFVLSVCNYGENNIIGELAGMRMIFCANGAVC